MYEDTVKRLRNCAIEAAPCKTCSMVDDGSCTSTLMKEAADAIEELQAQLMFSNDAAKAIAEKVPKWIPVAKRLPDVGKEVYVTDGEYVACANLLDDVFPGDQPCWSYSGIGEITHWCENIPLPHTSREE